MYWFARQVLERAVARPGQSRERHVRLAVNSQQEPKHGSHQLPFARHISMKLPWRRRQDLIVGTVIE